MANIAQEAVEIKLTVPWGHVSARTHGPSTGKRVLMVHGRLDNAGTFTRLMKYLSTDFYYVCIDLPGHGRSSHFPSGLMLDFLDYVYAIHVILDMLQWKTCIYIGHSMGAQIGVVYSVFRPQRIEKIIALDGIVPIPPPKDYFVTNLKDMFEISVKADTKVKPLFYTKEDVLYAHKFLRITTLNSDAAEALLERAVTKVNEKYKYNRDIRLKRPFFSVMDTDQYILIARKVSVPVYLFIASTGVKTKFNDIFKIIGAINPKILMLIHVDGNHDIHNNSPEKVAPYISKILNSDNSSKL